ncbi:type II toxin-antitoxin system PemK/MazF family toxin [Nostoc sp.]|uniref:type II toxin-antitoxin system PemK/MazF family toxin n=1 Tax=Nostoc sp. TaxID=1180 RepID=UPI0035947D98
MEGSIENIGKGDIISVPFPFSDASATKRRPALVIAESDSNNIMICPITSKPCRDYEIKLYANCIVSRKQNNVKSFCRSRWYIYRYCCCY